MYVPNSTSCANEGIARKADKSTVNHGELGHVLGFFWQKGLPFLLVSFQTCQKFVIYYQT
jgi:hypothetical protein